MQERIRVQLTGALAVVRRPYRDAAREVRGEHALVVVAEGRADRQVARELKAAHLAAVRVPQGHREVAAAGDQPAVVGEAHAQRARAVRRPALHLPAFLHLPELHRAVLAGGGQQLGVAAPAQGGDGRFMAGQREQLLRALRVPDADAAIAVGGGEHLAVRD